MKNDSPHKVFAVLANQDFLVTNKVEVHEILVDEPESVGGGNLAANPSQLVCSALASCTAITVKMYAKRKGWELGKVKVSVHLKSVGDQQKFVKRLSFEKQLDDQNMERLLLIASKCPISKLLSQENIMDLAHLNE